MKSLLRLLVLLALALGACSRSTSNNNGTGGACEETLAKACATQVQPGQFGVSCIDTWDHVLTDQRYCGGLPEYQADCGAYRSLSVVNVDSSYTYYYDKTTGALAAVYTSGPGGNGPQCAGGPAGFKLPRCGASQVLTPCPMDAGTSG